MKAIPIEVPIDDESEAIRQSYANGDFYRYATSDELRAGFEKVNEMIMNRKEFNEVFEVTVSEKMGSFKIVPERLGSTRKYADCT
ncbi:hypothetical protein [Sporosarcina sp. FSL K6-3457]|uniref:hypothetical protein n=1 Tax=Sporosarcina sp. FSL K6-3457 TaxID=2978204 RepID=UPI0030F54BA7